MIPPLVDEKAEPLIFVSSASAGNGYIALLREFAYRIGDGIVEAPIERTILIN